MFAGVEPGKLTLRRFFDLSKQSLEISRLKRGGKPKVEKPRPFGQN